MKTRFSIVLAVCLFACVFAGAQDATDKQDRQRFEFWVHRVLFLAIPRDGALTVVIDPKINVWDPDGFAFTALKEGDHVDFADKTLKATFTLTRMGDRSASFQYEAARKGRDEEGEVTSTIVKGAVEVPFAFDWQTACYFSDKDLMEKLLKSGLDPDSTDGFGRTPLMFAAYAGNLPICRMLLKAGAKVNLAQQEGITALMLAARHPGVADVLVRKGKANVDATDSQGRCVLHYAVSYPATVKSLIKGKVHMRAPAVNDALLLAVRKGDPKALEAMLEAGADPSARVGRFRLLRWAIMERRDEAAAVLIQAGATEQ